jgi:integrase
VENRVATDSKTKYLQKLGHSWYVRIRVPPSLQAKVGNTHIRRALHTRNLDEANALKWAAIASIKRDLGKLRLLDMDGDKARLYRDAINRARESQDYQTVESLELLAEDHAEEIYQSTGNLAKAQDWVTLAITDQKPLSDVLEDWLAKAEYTQQTKDKHRRALGELKAYLKGDWLPSMVTDRVALDYVEEYLKPLKLGKETKAGRLGSLSTFWGWMGKRLIVPKGYNPWHGQDMATKVDLKRSPDKRPYRDEELAKLLSGFQGAIDTRSSDKTALASLVLLGLYSGARLEELCRLTVEDLCEADGVFYANVVDSKTEAGKREFAISHATPVAILRHRLATIKTGFIFPDLKVGGRDQKRSHYVSRQYTVIRRRLGIPDGTDFHSFRRNFMTLMENLGVEYILVARYVGHQIPTLMHSTYSGGSWRQTSLRLANKVSYGEDIDGAAKVLLEFAVAK